MYSKSVRYIDAKTHCRRRYIWQWAILKFNVISRYEIQQCDAKVAQIFGRAKYLAYICILLTKNRIDMTAEDILKYCHFYKGEVIMPESLEGTNEGQLWIAEKAVCEEFANNIHASTAQKDVASIVAAYVGKWNPYGLADVMNTYLTKAPNVGTFIREVYL